MLGERHRFGIAAESVSIRMILPSSRRRRASPTPSPSQVASTICAPDERRDECDGQDHVHGETRSSAETAS
jgi:hypothetical protein